MLAVKKAKSTLQRRLQHAGYLRGYFIVCHCLLACSRSRKQRKKCVQVCMWEEKGGRRRVRQRERRGEERERNGLVGQLIDGWID